MTSDPSAHRAPATDAACALLGRLVYLGVAHIVISPGSRSQALALAAADLEARGLVQVHVRIDERVAGFTALGIGRETRMPAVVVCTSGTAVANLLPAALEAHHSGVPMLLLTADRPPELRGVGANQTTRQPGLFAAAARCEIDLPVPDAIDETGRGVQSALLRRIATDAVAASCGTAGRPAGPVHLNLPYREPLAGVIPTWFGADATGFGDVDPGTSAAGGPADAPVPTHEPAIVLDRGPRTVVVAGADAGPAAEALSHEGGWPLVAEIVSGARFGRTVVHGYRDLLTDPELGGRVQRAVVFGHPTLSREVVALLTRTDVDVVAARGPGEPLDLNGATSAVAAVAVAPGALDRAWLGEWMRASRAASVDLSPPAPDIAGLSSRVPAQRLEAVAAELQISRAPIDRETLVDAVWRATWPHDRLMFASSRLVRVADRVLPGKKVPVHANRGLAGIDGTLATATGIALASRRAGSHGVTRVLTGDLAFLHDVGALLLAADEEAPRLQIVVGNDGGGTIFDGLEVADVAAPSAMERVLYTPQTVQLDALAAAYGWDYVRATTRVELDRLLTGAPAGPQIVEVRLAR